MLIVLILAAFLLAGVVLIAAGRYGNIGVGIAAVAGLALLILLILLLFGVLPGGSLK